MSELKPWKMKKGELVATVPELREILKKHLDTVQELAKGYTRFMVGELREMCDKKNLKIPEKANGCLIQMAGMARRRSPAVGSGRGGQERASDCSSGEVCDWMEVEALEDDPQEVDNAYYDCEEGDTGNEHAETGKKILELEQCWAMREERTRQRAAVRKGEIEVHHNSPDYVLDGDEGNGAYDEDIDYKGAQGKELDEKDDRQLGPADEVVMKPIKDLYNTSVLPKFKEEGQPAVLEGIRIKEVRECILEDIMQFRSSRRNVLACRGKADGKPLKKPTQLLVSSEIYVNELRRPGPQRPARTVLPMDFNDEIAVDIFYLYDRGKIKHSILSVMDLALGYHVCRKIQRLRRRDGEPRDLGVTISEKAMDIPRSSGFLEYNRRWKMALQKVKQNPCQRTRPVVHGTGYVDLTSADTEDGGETASTWSMAARILSEAESKEVVKKETNKIVKMAQECKGEALRYQKVGNGNWDDLVLLVFHDHGRRTLKGIYSQLGYILSHTGRMHQTGRGLVPRRHHVIPIAYVKTLGNVSTSMTGLYLNSTVWTPRGVTTISLDVVVACPSPAYLGQIFTQLTAAQIVYKALLLTRPSGAWKIYRFGSPIVNYIVEPLLVPTVLPTATDAIFTDYDTFAAQLSVPTTAALQVAAVTSQLTQAWQTGARGAQLVQTMRRLEL
ncbi:unnamed protein product [Effrenium voratum]|nr:unnamed protein product [Effrenium voratum]